MTPATRAKAQELLKTLYDKVQASWPDFQRRDGQEAMMDAALSAFLNWKETDATSEGEHIALVEGPTGTGKTLGYLLAAIAAAKILDKTVVVSTATVALQDQLIQKDLPRLQSCLGIDLTFEMLKGRQRYVCLQKLARSGEPDTELMEMFESERTAARPARNGQASYGNGSPRGQQARPDPSTVSDAMTKAFGALTWDGDRDKWPEMVPDHLWMTVAADSSSCTHRNCADYKRCAFYEARKKASTAKIQVANHALVLATLVNDANTIDASKTVFVFDEGHHLPEIGLDQFATQMRLPRTVRALARSRTLLPKAAALAKKDSEWVVDAKAAIEAARECEGIIERLQADVLDDPAAQKQSLLRFEDGILPESWLQVIGQLAGALDTVLAAAHPAMDELLDPGVDAEVGTKEAAQLLASGWAPWMATLNEARWLLKQWLANDRVPLAKWATIHQESGAVTLSSSPLTAAKALNDHLWSRVSTALVTSATLTACGTFDFFARLSGLNRYPMRTELVAPAAFDYQRQARLCIPKMRASPKDGPAFTAELAQIYPSLLGAFSAGQLCLFASRKQMEAVYHALPQEWRDLVLMQDSTPRARLLAEHHRRVELGGRSVLFGLQSLGEGIDLPGRLCEQVIIEKIPFAPPDSPVDAALGEWLESQQRDAFAEVSVPKAGIKLAQWVGRAVRTVNDEAVITICDTRLRTARYGRRLLQGLPQMPSIQHPTEATF